MSNPNFPSCTKPVLYNPQITYVAKHRTPPSGAGIILVFFMFLLCNGFFFAPAADLIGPANMEAYTQEIVIVFSSPAAAQSAEIRSLPLYNGYEWAFSNYWDDNGFGSVETQTGHLMMHKVLSENGYPGTFCLIGERLNPVQVRAVRDNGFSLSAHTLSHQGIPFHNFNRIFEEFAGSMASIEAVGNSPVNSFNRPGGWRALSFVESVAEAQRYMLLRSGLYHIHVPRDPDPQRLFSTTQWLPYDHQLFWPLWAQSLNAFLQDTAAKRIDPIITMAGHSYYRESEWDWLADTLVKYGNNPAWWYCNHNQYAAYRYQYRFSALTTSRSGDTVQITLQRPLLTQLNDAVPLTVSIEGVAPETITGVSCVTAACSVGASAGTYHIFHDRSQALPDVVGLVRNSNSLSLNRTNTDTDAEVPGVKASLRYSRDSLYLVVENSGASSMSDVRITYRVPLAFEDEPELRREGDIGQGETLVRSLWLKRVTNEYEYTSGIYYLHAQIDFIRGETPQRLYAACRWENPHVDYTYPQTGFLVHTVKTTDVDAALSALSAGTFSLSNFQAPGGHSPQNRLNIWYTLDTLTHRTYFSPEIIGQGSRSYGDTVKILCRSLLYSSEEQTVKFLWDSPNAKVMLNGEMVAGLPQTLATDDGRTRPAGDTATLNKGYNTLVTANAAGQGIFFKTVNPQTHELAKNVWYVPVLEPSTPSRVACRDIPALYTDASDTVRVEAWFVDDSGHIVPHIEDAVTFSLGAGGTWADGTTGNKTVPVVNAIASIGARATGTSPVTVTASYGTLSAGTAAVYPRSGYVTSVRRSADMSHGADIRIRQQTNGIAFYNVPPGAGLTVLSLSGRRVLTVSDETGSGTIRLGNDRSAVTLPPRGMYLYSITDKAGSRLTGKFLVR